jgi:hydrogenase maturation protease
MILIIGYGNPLRSDDGVGQAIAETISEWGLEDVKTIATSQLMPELADDIAQASLVIFVDVAKPTDQAGALRNVDVREVVSARLMPVPTQSRLSHHTTPGMLLALIESLHGNHPQAILVCVPGETFELGESFSATTQRAMTEALREIRVLIDEAGAGAKRD